MAQRFAIVLVSLLAFVAANASAAPVGKESKLSSERLRELQKERIKFLEEYLEGLSTRVKLRPDLLNNFIEGVRELADAELDVAESREQRLVVYERMVKRLQDREDKTANLIATGMDNKHNLALIKAARIKAEIQLEKMKLSK